MCRAPRLFTRRFRLQAMLAKAEQQMMEAAIKQLEVARSRRKNRTTEQAQRSDWIDKQRYNVAIRPTRTSGRFRFRSMPMLGEPEGSNTVEIGCSRAEALDEFRARHSAGGA